MQTIWQILEATWAMALAAAPWLTVGLVVAALIKVYVPSAWLTQFLKGRGGVIKAAFIGAPLPLCSCGVIPAALALRRQGASRGSVMAFLVATPETGVDSVAVSYALLGPFLAVVRPVSAIFSAIVTGLVGAAIPEASTIGSEAQAGPPAVNEPANAVAEAGDCCASKPETSCCESKNPEPPKASCCSSKSEPIPASSCCASKAKPASSCCSSKADTTMQSKPGLFTALIHAAAEVLGDTMKWLLIGLLIAGVISVYFTEDSLKSLGSGLPVMLLMVVVGIPMYICATASTPLAAGLLLAGLSPGAVLVFMLAGPATNVATIGVVRRELGTRYMLAYVLAVSISAIACGLATDALASALNVNAIAQAQAAHHHEIVPHWLAIACLIVLALLAIKPLRVRLFSPTPQPA